MKQKHPTNKDMKPIRDFLAQYGINDPIIISRTSTLNFVEDWEDIIKIVANALTQDKQFLQVVVSAIATAIAYPHGSVAYPTNNQNLN
jgi:hypothetical protein